MDVYGYYRGKSTNAYEYLGCHLIDDGAVFRVYAPKAKGITIVGDFNDWSSAEIMVRAFGGDVWECFIKDAKPGMHYKYRIYTGEDIYTEHADPYGFSMDLRPDFASKIVDMEKFEFTDSAWMKKRTDRRNEALNIYELHLGSWKKPGENKEDWYTYEEVADLLIPYLKKNGYNYIELMPITEHPCDNSWGYQTTGFFSPTARYGSPDDLKSFINKCHLNGIGIILDFVPVHFAMDSYGLAMFDGTPLYEYPTDDVGFSQWGSKNFNLAKGETQNFLLSSACFWLKEYHFDGLRMDAISNMIYWMGNSNRGINGPAVGFIKHMNGTIKSMFPGVILAAEDSSSYPGVTRPTGEDGLGFDYKWDMGWMNDTLEFFRTAPEYRYRDYNKLTFSMMYYPSEHFMMALSHDEVVHGKATILQQMNGQYEDKFPQARALYMYMYSHPGKKLNFMGNEIGQLREWDEEREQDWDILKYPKHDDFRRFMKDLNKLYLKHSAFYERDYADKGFFWLESNDREHVVYAYERASEKERIAVVLNLSDRDYDEYNLNIGFCKGLKALMSSDETIYGGSTKIDKKEVIEVEEGKAKLKLPRFSAQFYQVIY